MLSLAHLVDMRTCLSLKYNSSAGIHILFRSSSFTGLLETVIAVVVASSSVLEAGGTLSRPMGEASSRPMGEDSSRPMGEDSSRPMGEASSRPMGEDSSRPMGEDSSRPMGEASSRPMGEASAWSYLKCEASWS